MKWKPDITYWPWKAFGQSIKKSWEKSLGSRRIISQGKNSRRLTTYYHDFPPLCRIHQSTHSSWPAAPCRWGSPTCRGRCRQAAPKITILFGLLIQLYGSCLSTSFLIIVENSIIAFIALLLVSRGRARKESFQFGKRINYRIIFFWQSIAFCNNQTHRI